MAQKSQLLAGAAEVDITPTLGVEMCGYGPCERRVAIDILDPLYARALWLTSRNGRTGDDIVIISVDILSIDRATRDAVARGLARRFGVADSAVMVAASHTHSGPAGQRMIGWGERDSSYLRRLARRLVEVAVKARAALQPAAIGFTRQRITGVGVNREQFHLGPTDPAAQLMRIDARDGRPIAVVFNYGAHPVTRYAYSSRISADWPGLVAGSFKVWLDGAVPIFLQGACGNINGHEFTSRRDRPTELQQLCDARCGDAARRFVEQALPAIRAIKTAPSAELSSAMHELELPCVPLDRRELQGLLRQYEGAAKALTLRKFRPLHVRLTCETPREAAWRVARCKVDQARAQLALLGRRPNRETAPLQLLRIGEAAIVGWPAEVYVELGLELRQRSPAPMTFVTTLANHCVGYIPTPWAYESQGQPHQFGKYPTRDTPGIWGRLPFRPDVGRLLVEQSLAMLYLE